MTAEVNPPFLISLDDAACVRLANVQKSSIAASGTSAQVTVALPASYAKNRKKSYPLLIALDASQNIGSLIEMSRLMAETKEINECIVVGLNCAVDGNSDFPKLTSWLEQTVIPWCKSSYRVLGDEIAVSGTGKLGAFALHLMLNGSGVANAFVVSDPDPLAGSEVLAQFRRRGKIAAATTPRLALTLHGAGRRGSSSAQGSEASLQQFFSALQGTLASVASVFEQKLDDTPAADMGIPAITHGLRSFWQTHKVYGDGISAMRAAWIPVVLGALAPLLRILQSKPGSASDANNAYLLRSETMDRNFEIFVSLPRSFNAGSNRRYPVICVLDANIEFSTAAEAAAALAAEGVTEEAIVIGIGVPRAEGPIAFGFRRFEEFSPPADGYDFKDDLGRIFRSLFATRGVDARKQLGLAPQFFDFVTKDLLPKLATQFPMDSSNMGLIGHSAGGTFILYAMCQATSPFRHYAGVSPGLAVSGSWLLNRKDADLRVAKAAKTVFLSLGSEERANLFNQYAGIDQTEAFAERLSKVTELAVTSMCFENETHSSTYPRAVINAISSAFPRIDPAAKA